MFQPNHGSEATGLLPPNISTTFYPSWATESSITPIRYDLTITYVDGTTETFRQVHSYTLKNDHLIIGMGINEEDREPDDPTVGAGLFKYIPVSRYTEFTARFKTAHPKNQKEEPIHESE